MRKSIIALAALALTSTTALAADYAEPAPEAFSWTGFYAGVFAAYNDVNRELDSDTTILLPFPDESEESLSGFSGGALVGFNYQFDSIVVGIEGDIAFASIEDNSTALVLIGPTEDEIDMTYAVRARLGYAIDRTLLFVTGGVAWADYELRTGLLLPPGIDDALLDETLFGFQIGGGVEHALTDSITLRLDYLYTDYESEDINHPILPQPVFDNPEVDLDSHTIRFGVNFLLNAL